MRELLDRIAGRNATIGVVGLGYVGIAVACAFADAGFDVLGVDIDSKRVAAINAGRELFGPREPELDSMLLRLVAASRLSASTDYAPLSAADVVVIAVDTPVGDDHRPRFESLGTACRQLARVMKREVLVVVESTVAPGTCDGLVAALLEQGGGARREEGFFLGHCPERVTPGRLLENLRTLPRVCGASSARTHEAMVALYRTIVHGKLTTADCLTAELVKAAENTYRDVNIAFANELALICEAVGADFARVRELVNESPGRHVLVAGPGVGGPCIPKDPWLLAAGAPGFEPRLIAAAREVNDRMPAHVARLVEDAFVETGKSMASSRVAVLGFTYREGAEDTRNSPSRTLVSYLTQAGADVRIHDPLVPEYAGPIEQVVTGCDAVVLMVGHEAYVSLDLAQLRVLLRTPIVVDGRQIMDAGDAERAGLIFRGLGRGQRSPVSESVPAADSAGPASTPLSQGHELPEHLGPVLDGSNAGRAVGLG